jgi:predicted nucleotidyltransferase
MGIQELIGGQKDEILAIAAKYGAFNVRIFGSVANGTADETSDVDFLWSIWKMDAACSTSAAC